MDYVQLLNVSLIVFVVFCHTVIGQQQAPAIQDVKIKIVVPNLPTHHYQFWLKNHPKAFEEFKQICSQAPQPLDLTNRNYFQALHANLSLEDPRYLTNFDHGRQVLHDICSKIELVSNSCWGYESNCHIIHLMPECHGYGSSSDKEEQDRKISWFSQADFGYILDRRREMNRYCSPDKYSNDSMKSSLECTKFFRTCRGYNLLMRFNGATKVGDSIKKDLFSKDDIGGWNCDLQLKRIQEEKGHQEPLQSWFNELNQYNNLIREDPKACDLVIDKQVFLVKLDSPTNMYRYFSTFLNLYATIHLNNRFSEDNQIIVWDDLPRSKFDLMWNAFSRNPLLSIKQFENKRICFNRFIASLPPKMVEGLYQGATLVPGCSKSGLFDAFNKHVLHRLGIQQRYDLDNASNESPIRVTIVTRMSLHRRILNQQELFDALAAKQNEYHVRMLDLSEKTLREQLDISQNTDLLVGINGAALTNLLFLPDWAAFLEVHDCGEKTYSDLARLRGVKYFASRDKEKFATKHQVDDENEKARLTKINLVNHDKFSNYKIDVDEFTVLIKQAAETIKKNRQQYVKKQQVRTDKREPIEKEKLVQSGQTNSHTEL